MDKEIRIFKRDLYLYDSDDQFSKTTPLSLRLQRTWAVEADGCEVEFESEDSQIGYACVALPNGYRFEIWRDWTIEKEKQP